MRLAAFLLFFSVGTFNCRADLIAKSSVTMCENNGDSEDPFNVVDNKSCEKKLIVTMSVQSGQKGTESIVTTSKVYDQVEKEMGRLYNPFVIRLAKTPVTLVYPYYHRGVVNNKPKEKKVVSDAGGWVSGSRNLCNDAWEDDDATCGFQRDKNGDKLWDSQGFCCWCSEQDKWRQSFGDSVPFTRGDLKCKLFSKKQASAHCMEYDKLWYSVHEIGLWEMYFNIHVYTWDLQLKKVGNKTVKDLVYGGEILIGPTRRRGVGVHGRLHASFIGEFSSHKQFPTLTEKLLLMPLTQNGIDPKTHAQVKGGPAEYMIIDKHEVNYKPEGPHQCDKIGVTFTAFRKQAPQGCYQKMQSCLANQPKDYFQKDKERLKEKKRPLYFPRRYGKFMGVNRTIGSKQFVLAYEVQEVMTSMVTLQISADDIILVYNRATGKILRVYASDFQALSMNGMLYVIVQNTGLVTADFYVMLHSCTVGIGGFHEKMASINPQKTLKFSFEVKAYRQEDSINTCVVHLYDSRRKLMDSTNVTFKTSEPCYCAAACGCSCYKDGFKCVERDKRNWSTNKTEDSGLDLSPVRNFFESIWDSIYGFFAGLSKVFRYLLLAAIAIVVILIAVGCCRKCMPLCCKLCMKVWVLAKKATTRKSKGTKPEGSHSTKKIARKKTKKGEDIDKADTEEEEYFTDSDWPSSEWDSSSLSEQYSQQSLPPPPPPAQGLSQLSFSQQRLPPPPPPAQPASQLSFSQQNLPPPPPPPVQPTSQLSFAQQSLPPPPPPPVQPTSQLSLSQRLPPPPAQRVSQLSLSQQRLPPPPAQPASQLSLSQQRLPPPPPPEPKYPQPPPANRGVISGYYQHSFPQPRGGAWLPIPRNPLSTRAPPPLPSTFKPPPGDGF